MTGRWMKGEEEEGKRDRGGGGVDEVEEERGATVRKKRCGSEMKVITRMGIKR